jgi:hypothetical protein
MFEFGITVALLNQGFVFGYMRSINSSWDWMETQGDNNVMDVFENEYDTESDMVTET